MDVRSSSLWVSVVIAVHLLWIVLVLVGVFWTRGRPVWTAVHLVCLVWGIVVEVGPWSCPLTLLEDYLERHGAERAVNGNFVLHSVQALIYPDAPYWLVTTIGVAACTLILGIYAWRGWVWWRRRRAGRSLSA
jgi:hypothetical protein